MRQTPSSISTTIRTPPFTFLFWKDTSGVQHHIQNLTILPGHWTRSFISVLGRPSRAIKHYRWHSTAPQLQPLWWPLAIAKGAKTSLSRLSCEFDLSQKQLGWDYLGTVWLVLHYLWLYHRLAYRLLHLYLIPYSWAGMQLLTRRDTLILTKTRRGLPTVMTLR